MKNKIYLPEKLEILREWLQKAETIVITNHKNPDGDAMGAALALYHFLRKWGFPAHVVVPNEYAKFLKWLPGNDEVLTYDGHPEKCAGLLEKADVIFALDYNDVRRSGRLSEHIENASGNTVLIDHHENPTDFADLVFSDPRSCATAELIYELVEELGRLDLLDVQSATCIYTGLVTDTGSFRFAATTAKTHNIVAHLLEIGVKHELVHRNLYDNKSEILLKMRGHVLSNNLVVLTEYKTAYISLSSAEQEKYNTKPGDTEGLVNEALGIEGVVMSAFFKEDDDLIKISFRSVGEFPVNTLSSRHFDGGGHTNAAGGNSKQSMEETIARFKSILPEFKAQLDATN